MRWAGSRNISHLTGCGRTVFPEDRRFELRPVHHEGRKNKAEPFRVRLNSDWFIRREILFVENLDDMCPPIHARLLLHSKAVVAHAGVMFRDFLAVRRMGLRRLLNEYSKLHSK